MTAPNLRGEPAADVLAPPGQLRASFGLWLLAVAAGLSETALAVIDATSGLPARRPRSPWASLSGC